MAKTKREFFEILSEQLDIAKESLEIKRKTLEQFAEKGLYPYTKVYLGNIKKRTGLYWINHFSTIGIIGMHEACINLLNEGIDSDCGVSFAEEVLLFLRDKLSAFQEETGHNYNLEATPAEGTSYRLAQLDREHYPEIAEKLYNGKEKDFVYTNSTQLPVDHSFDVFETLDKQDRLQDLYTGGTILHIFLGESVADYASIKAFVRKVCSNYRLPYFSITPTFSICPVHGYLRGAHVNCPDCGSEAEVYSRIVGYFRPIRQWNIGKQWEFDRRSCYTFDEHRGEEK